MHLERITLFPEKYPTTDFYPFCLEILNRTKEIVFHTPVTYFIGENGSGKSTMLRAIAKKCGIHIWNEDNQTFDDSKYTEEFYRYIDIKWHTEKVPGSFFASEIFRYFAKSIDDWSVKDPGMLGHFGGEKYLSKSHGQYHMAYFKSRYKLKGLYLLDEPENALSPQKQLELLKIIKQMSGAGHAQFIIATHSPILLALPEACIFSFNDIPVTEVEYEDTDYYKFYKDFLNNREKYLELI